MAVVEAGICELPSRGSLGRLSTGGSVPNLLRRGARRRRANALYVRLLGARAVQLPISILVFLSDKKNMGCLTSKSITVVPRNAFL